jgi:hypothetical protein
MSNYGYTEHERNWWAERYRQGAALVVLGWLLFSGAALGGIYFFASLAVGSSFWLWFSGVLGIAGLAMVGIGSRMKNQPQTHLVETEHRPDRVA